MYKKIQICYKSLGLTFQQNSVHMPKCIACFTDHGFYFDSPKFEALLHVSSKLNKALMMIIEVLTTLTGLNIDQMSKIFLYPTNNMFNRLDRGPGFFFYPSKNISESISRPSLYKDVLSPLMQLSYWVLILETFLDFPQLQHYPLCIFPNEETLSSRSNKILGVGCGSIGRYTFFVLIMLSNKTNYKIKTFVFLNFEQTCLK